MSDYVLGTSPPERRSPNAAFLLGLCLGPLGTAWTFAPWQDTALTGIVYVVATWAWGGRGMMVALVFAGLYGALRVMRDNARWEAAGHAAVLADMLPVPGEASAVVIELEAEDVFSPPTASSVAIEPEPAFALPATSSADTAAPEMPAVEPTAARVEPPALPDSPAPRKRGRPKGSRKLAA